jgi:hypothetical protein
LPGVKLAVSSMSHSTLKKVVYIERPRPESGLLGLGTLPAGQCLCLPKMPGTPV